MRAVVQRVSSASVTIDRNITAEISRGLLILLGIHKSDTSGDVEWLTTRIVKLRIFADVDDKMNRSLLDLDQTEATPKVLVVSQFTLFASTRKGNRPSFNDAASPDEAFQLYESFLSQLSKIGAGPVASGTFGAMMQVSLVNDGPVTLILDSKLRE